ncbi:MAG: sigma-70 family RNA polymerase sigma factor [Synergistaceae bacterium]|nr:sigma-70 family RNA polymerase sigma factor [Synergistaceae bacterium]
MDEVRGRASLAPDAEKILWDGAAGGDEECRESLILAYRPMVFWLARRLHVPYNSYPDLIQEGMVGLISAVDNFEPSRSNKFITYAYYKVKGRMVNFLQRSEARAPIPVEEMYLERPDSFEEDIDSMEWHISLDDGLGALPARERDIVRSLIIEGRNASDVAIEQGVGVSHIYRLQRRAIARLKSLFIKEDATSDA